LAIKSPYGNNNPYKTIKPSYGLDDITGDSVREEWYRYERANSEWREQVAEDEDFYLGNQLTEKQKEYLQSVGQPPECNNKIRPAVEQVLANVASSSPVWSVQPEGKTDSEISFIYSQLMDRIWYDSDGDHHFRKMTRDFLVKGIAYAYVYPDWNADEGLGALRLKKMNPESIFVDPNSILPDFSDASSIIYSDIMTKKQAVTLFPKLEKIIEDAMEEQWGNDKSSGNFDRDYKVRRADGYQDNEEGKVRKFVRWTKIAIPKMRITEVGTGFSKNLDKDQWDEIREDEDFKQFLMDGAIQVMETFEPAIRESCVFGDILGYDYILPLSQYPILPACNEHASNPFPTGDVRHAKTPQRMLNRTEALLIAHTNATANFKLIYEDGAIDPEELGKWSIPNAVIRANPGAIQQNKIKEYSPPAISSSLYQEKQRYEVDIEQVFGAYKFSQGNPDASPGTVGEAGLIDEAVAKKQNWKILPIYDMLTKAAQICVQWIPHIYDQQRVLRFVNPQGDDKEVQLNLPVEDRTGAVTKLYDMTTAKADIRAVIGSTRAKNPLQDLQRDIGLMQAGIYDKTQVIMNMQSDIDKGALLERQSEIAQLTQQVEQLQGQVKSLSGDLQTREREVFHTKMRAEVAEATKPIASAVADAKARTKIETARQKDASAKAEEQVNSLQQAANNMGVT
tara:strand:- start:10479 stop:12515 length:2037 start_codon:yes stop_codon:yes gene_type:complete